MNNYKLLTPGPLTTTDSVKQEMLFDHCTWDDEYKIITQKIRKDLLDFAHCSEETYTTVLMQGSGTFGVEAVITSAVGENEKLLICSNGAYGLRMCDIAKHGKIPFVHYGEKFDTVPQADKIAGYLTEQPDITHVAMVHSETTSGILNNIKSVAALCKKTGRVLIVDAMSSFGGIDIPVEEMEIDFIVSSANKCIQGVPGFSFIIAKREAVKSCEGKARSLSLDVYDQWKDMEKDGKWRFTSPTHTVLAFAKAIEELKAEGGIAAREKRYKENNHKLIEGMKQMGFEPYITKTLQSPIITTFFYPEHIRIEFYDLYSYIKDRGYAIYPGKLTEGQTFRIGNIGEIYEDDIEKLLNIIKDYIKEKTN